MNLVLNYEGFEDCLTFKFVYEDAECGYYEFQFDNGYGASVLKQTGSIACEQDLWKVKVREYNNQLQKWTLSSKNPFTGRGTLLGRNCSDEDVQMLLGLIKNYSY